MKVYSKIVIDIATGQPVESLAYEYSGPVAQAKGSTAASPSMPASGRILLRDLRQDLSPAIRQDIINDPFRNEASVQYRDTMNQIRGSYGARGLAGSGIAIEGEQRAIGDIQAKAQAQRAGQLTNILATGSGAPTSIAGSQPRGFMGLK
jgi:hypothetical protein